MDFYVQLSTTLISRWQSYETFLLTCLGRTYCSVMLRPSLSVLRALLSDEEDGTCQV